MSYGLIAGQRHWCGMPIWLGVVRFREWFILEKGIRANYALGLPWVLDQSAIEDASLPFAEPHFLRTALSFKPVVP